VLYPAANSAEAVQPSCRSREAVAPATRTSCARTPPLLMAMSWGWTPAVKVLFGVTLRRLPWECDEG
jgi:hypothetical protein